MSPASRGEDAEIDRTRRRLGLALGPALFVVVLLIPTALPPPAQRLAAVVMLAMTYWITEAIPLPATALLAPALAVVLGVSKPQQALAPFADPVIFLFLGSFLLAEALNVHGLDRRIALRILAMRGVSASTGRMRLAVGLVTAGISMWMNNTATTAMMVPVALGLLRALDNAGVRELPKAILLFVAIAASLGGIGTPVGTAPNLIGLGFLERLGGRHVGFLEFMMLGVPLSLALMAVTFLVLRLAIPTVRGSVDVRSYVQRERRALGVWGAGQWACTTAFGFAVTLWLLPGVLATIGVDSSGWLGRIVARLDEPIVAILAAVMLFFWPVGNGRTALTWKEGVRVEWGTLLLFGGGLSLGTMMSETGLAKVLGRGAVEATGIQSLWGLTALALATSILLTETTSNTATVSMLGPIVAALAQEMNVSMVPPVLAVTFGASMGFMFPIGTPPNAIVYATGLIPMTSMIRVGVVVDVLSFFVILGVLRVLCPLLGLT